MLGKGKKKTILLCSSIVILFILCSIAILSSFFIKDSITTETIVGINPISSTKSTLAYQEPLTVILEKEEQEKEAVQNVEEATEVQEIKEEKIEISNLEENSKIGEQLTEKEAKSNANETGINLVENVMLENGQEEIQSTVETEYKGFATVGKIEIPQTGVDIPILKQVTVEGMKNAPCLLYSTGELNQNGNNLIVGHNFRNGTIFSNNKNLKLGDKIYVTTLDGNKVEYTIYSKFITTAEDVSYIKRDTNNKPEITLSCCTDDDEYRIIILARI